MAVPSLSVIISIGVELSMIFAGSGVLNLFSYPMTALRIWPMPGSASFASLKEIGNIFVAVGIPNGIMNLDKWVLGTACRFEVCEELVSRKRAIRSVRFRDGAS